MLKTTGCGLFGGEIVLGIYDVMNEPEKRIQTIKTDDAISNMHIII